MIYPSEPLQVHPSSRAALTVIDQEGTPLFQKIAEYRRYGTLFVFLALRDITLRYRQTLLGVIWAVLQPLLPMVIFTVVFARRTSAIHRPSAHGSLFSPELLPGLSSQMRSARREGRLRATTIF